MDHFEHRPSLAISAWDGCPYSGTVVGWRDCAILMLLAAGPLDHPASRYSYGPAHPPEMSAGSVLTVRSRQLRPPGPEYPSPPVPGAAERRPLSAISPTNTTEQRICLVNVPDQLLVRDAQTRRDTSSCRIWRQELSEVSHPAFSPVRCQFPRGRVHADMRHREHM